MLSREAQNKFGICTGREGLLLFLAEGGRATHPDHKVGRRYREGGLLLFLAEEGRGPHPEHKVGRRYREGGSVTISCRGGGEEKKKKRKKAGWRIEI